MADASGNSPCINVHSAAEGTDRQVLSDLEKIWKTCVKTSWNLENRKKSAKSGKSEKIRKIWKNLKKSEKSGKSGKFAISPSKSAPISGGILSLFSTFWKNVTFSKILDFFPKFPLFPKNLRFSRFSDFHEVFVHVFWKFYYLEGTHMPPDPQFVRPTWAGPDGDSYVNHISFHSLF